MWHCFAFYLVKGANGHKKQLPQKKKLFTAGNFMWPNDLLPISEDGEWGATGPSYSIRTS